MSESKLKPEELANKINYKPVRKSWMLLKLNVEFIITAAFLKT